MKWLEVEEVSLFCGIQGSYPLVTHSLDDQGDILGEWPKEVNYKVLQKARWKKMEAWDTVELITSCELLNAAFISALSNTI